MANEFKCLRCSTVNDGSSITCVSCGLMRGSAALPTSPSALRGSESTPPAPPDSAVPGPAPDPTWPAANGSLATGPGWAALREPTDARDRESVQPGAAPADDADQASRGAGDQPPPPPGPPVPLWRRIPIGGLLFLVLIVGGGIASWYFGADRSEAGEITDSGDLQATDLRVGDCFDLKEPEASELEDVTAIPCTQEHEYEVYFEGSLPEGPYPNITVFEQYVVDNCDASFTAYVGKAYADSELDLYWLYPTDDAWREGDRVVQCAVFHPRVSRLTTSLKGSKR